MDREYYDVVIIGAGVIGAAIAREISKYELSVCVVEKEEDVCSGTSKANSGIIHAGHDAMTGSKKARFNLEGNRMIPALSKELDFEFRQNGSLVVCTKEEDMPKLEELYQRGIANGVEGLRILSCKEVKEMEKNISDEVIAALYAPTGGIVCPFSMTIALAENACDNGVEFRFDEEVYEIRRGEKGFLIKTEKGEIYTEYIVNAAGVYADKFHNMVSEKKLHIIPRKGDYCILDRTEAGIVNATIFGVPGKMGKGILVTPTIFGNPLLGPTATDVEEKENNATTEEELAFIIERAGSGVKDVPLRKIITSFSGLRAHEMGDDFVIGETEDCENFFDAAGIESPGLTSAPAIGVFLATEIVKKKGAKKKENWNGKRKGIIRVKDLPEQERMEWIQKDKNYGKIVCRCEEVSEGEIIDAITRTLGASSLDGIKRRVRQGTGRCQAGFCTPRTLELLAEYRGIPVEKVCKNRKGSEILKGGEKE